MKNSLSPHRKVENISVVGLVFGALLMFGALYKIYGLLDYDYYRFMFQYLSAEWTAIRYCGSLALRGVALVTAFGLFRQVDFYRRVAVGLAVLTLVSLPWKHPFEVFFHIAVYSEMGFPGIYPVLTGNEVLAYPYFPVISQIFFNALDAVFNGAMLWVLTRPWARAQFH